MVSQKGKTKIVVESPILPLVINLDELPLINTQFKITETQCEFDLYELHNWAYKKIKDASDKFCFWELMLPQFCFPQTHHFHEFITWCESRYLPSQRAIVARNN